MTAPAAQRAAMEAWAKAQACHRSGQLGLAESHYQRVAKLDPQNAEAWHLLGVVAYQSGKVEKALKHYRKALDLRPRSAQVLNNLALAQRSIGALDAAAEAFEQAIAVRPEYVEAAFNLALLRDQQGDPNASERAYRRALSWRPDYQDALWNLGNLLRKQHRLDDSAALLEQAWKLAPDNPVSCGNLALLRIDQGRWNEASELAAAACRTDPTAARWWEALGVSALLRNDPDQALAPLRRASELAPDSAGIWLEFGQAHEECADLPEAMNCYRRALRLAPDWQRAHWAAALALPAIAQSAEEELRSVQSLGEQIDQLHRQVKLDSPATVQDALDAAQAYEPFRLHYFSGEHSALQNRFGDLISAVVAAAAPTLSVQSQWRALAHGGRLRVGFVSSYLREHVVARYFSDWIVSLDPARFESYVWYTGSNSDVVSTRIAAAADHFTHSQATPLQLAQQIRDAQLDALIHLDVGLDPRQHIVAALRLAPVQCVGYGHPVTSGIANVDYFLSAHAYEPVDGDAHYRERLVRLPGLGTRPRRAASVGDDTWMSRLTVQGPLLVCAQNLLKLTPAFDDILARVAAATHARLLFFDRGTAVTQCFRTRLARALTSHGLDPQSTICIEPAHTHADFVAGIGVADLVLDSPGFSGGATSLDALAMGTPVLAFEGTSARGRQTSGMLRLLDLPQLIASDADDYVQRASRLLADRSHLSTLRTTILSRVERLFDDPAPQAALEEFLQRAVADRIAAGDVASTDVAGAGL